MDIGFAGSSCTIDEVEPWGDSEKICCNFDFDSDEERETIIYEARCMATELLDQLSGYRYGFRRDRVMPCRTGCVVCYCDPCSCCRYDKLYLPLTPACCLTRVVIDCVDEDLANYRVDDGWSSCPVAVKLDGPWPTEQCLTDYCDPQDDSSVSNGTGGWWIEYVYGQPVPKLGHFAANALACEFVYRCVAPDKCSLPLGTTSVQRQGVSFSVQDISGSLNNGLTGIASVDMFLRAVNPDGTRGMVSVYGLETACKPGFVRPGSVCV